VEVSCDIWTKEIVVKLRITCWENIIAADCQAEEYEKNPDQQNFSAFSYEEKKQRLKNNGGNCFASSKINY